MGLSASTTIRMPWEGMGAAEDAGWPVALGTGCWGVSKTMRDPTAKGSHLSGHHKSLPEPTAILERTGEPNGNKNDASRGSNLL